MAITARNREVLKRKQRQHTPPPPLTNYNGFEEDTTSDDLEDYSNILL